MDTLRCMIREISISAHDESEDAPDEITEPPARVLNVAVVAGTAHLFIYDMAVTGIRSVEPLEMVRVSAESLRLALTALMEDEAR